ncbi:inner nuclear membrane protein enriched at telomere/subtelomere region [Conoideocrella luteorostrata]|uniref:Inner nuclear membrane protein enriched at telomere/subtelomere region n=1 Tax=Conoideocrella luteorostrata TaxID=1105319 RepID=A0AAJ0CW49_9HYPO|nr:inner nuclear membrane protein enriched at telomere/subtelomere region [Conoideocrella luteorostrata]
MADADDYLQEGFDPRNVTVPRLRSILVTHNIDYPSTAKKGQLVELVNDHVLSQAPKLRAQRAKAKRSSLGFVNAGSADDSNAWRDQEPRSRQSSYRRSMSPRKSSGRIKAEPEEPESDILRSTRKRSSRSASRQLSHFDDDDGTASIASRSTRKTSRRAVTPQIKTESEPEDGDEYPSYVDHSNESLDPPEEEDEHDESVFTDDNPFQSGGSSPPPVVTPKSRRRTLGEDVSKSARSSRRRTDGYSDKPKKSRASEASAHKLRQKTPEFALEPGEEFTVDEQLELEEALNSGEVAVAPKKSRKPTRQTSILTPLFVLLMALLGAYGAWYRQEKLAVGYCGLGRPAKQLLPPEIVVPDVLVPFVEPQCESCPQNAYCYEGFAVRCVSGFIQKPHPLSLGGLVPLPPTCEPDSEQERRVQAVADKAVEELRERRAKYECGDLVDEAGHQEDSPAIAEEELKEAVSKKRNKRLSNEEFDELWDKAIGKVTTREEVQVEVQLETAKPPGSPDLPVRKLSSTSLARLPLSCAIKRSVWLGLARYRLAIGLLISLVLGTFYVRARYRRHIATSAQIPALVDLVLGRLANQRELGEEDLDDPWLFLPNLRDDVLRAIHSLAERDRVWQRVRAVVEQNSNVRTSQREGRNGEVGRAWEWIGPTQGEGARRRRSGRVSWAPASKEETPDGNNLTDVKKWEESRPIY